MRWITLCLIAACAPAQPARPSAPLALPPPHATPNHALTVTPLESVDLMRIRDPRHIAIDHTRLDARAAQLEELLAATPSSSPDRARIHDRLAEDHVKRRKLGEARQSAVIIEHYDAIIREHPTYSDLDAVLYYDGIEHEVSGDVVGAYVLYRELVQRMPTSVYAPYAYFGAGEVLFTEAVAEPMKFREAIDCYSEAIEYTDSPIAPEAAYRIIQVYDAIGDRERAILMRARLVRDFARSSAAQRVRADR